MSSDWIEVGKVLVLYAAMFGPILGFRLRWNSLSRRRPGLEGQELVVRSAGGRVLGRIDTSRPYKVRTPYKAYGHATYRIDQGRERVLFTSDSPGAPEIVRNVLGLEFPPKRMRWPMM